jgi:hypothetical protein
MRHRRKPDKLRRSAVACASALARKLAGMTTAVVTIRTSLALAIETPRISCEDHAETWNFGQRTFKPAMPFEVRSDAA